MLISFNLLDVSARKIQCSCSSDPESDESKGVRFMIYFTFKDNNLIDAPLFDLSVNGETLTYETGIFGGQIKHYQFKIQNWNEIKGENNGYTFKDEFNKTDKCPSYVIYVRQPAIDMLAEGNSFYASDDISKSDIINYGKKTLDFPQTTAEAYVGTCRTTIIEDDPVVSNSNEPSNEPSDPNSNIPTVNSNKTLNDDNTIYFCGSDKADTAVMRNIPADVPRIIRFLYIFLQVLVPIGIVVVSSIDLFKAISAQKEDDIKKGQQTLIKRIIAAVIIFFVFAIVKLVLSVISDNSDSIIDCISCFLENSDEYCIKHVQ